MSKVIYDNEGRMNLVLRAVPYYGPEYLNEKDLQGHFFHPGTDTGPLPMALSYLNHNKLQAEHPELKSLPGIDDRIGVAMREPELSDEEGIVYRIIVDESYKYKNLLKVLAEKDLLLASTTPFQRSVKIDESTGRIDRWEVIEVAPTWKAANPEAENLAKSLIEQELTKMEENTNVQVETSEENPVTEEKPTLTQMVEQAAAEVEEAEKSTNVTLADLLAAIKEANQRTAALEKSVADLSEVINKRGEAQEKSISDIQTAFPKLVELATKKAAASVAADSKLSSLEKSVTPELQNNSKNGPVGRSDTAPGRDRKANFGGRG